MALRRSVSQLPDWPVLLDQAQACRFLSYTRAQFHALVKAGLLPPPREHHPGEPRWYRRELERCLDRLYQLEESHSDEHAKLAARRALDSYQPAPARRANPQQPRAGLPVLPARRAKDTPPPA